MIISLTRFPHLLHVLLATGCLFLTTPSLANHPVLVEGESDYDGDGLLGVDEDNDGNEDQVFGTLTAALDANNRGANQNGHVVIVTSGRFNESLVITAEHGDVSIEAAAGVEAIIDAVRAGDPGSTRRQNMAGILVDAPANRRVILRNLVSRNWANGIVVQGASNVLIDGCRVEHNVNHNLHLIDVAVVAIINSTISNAGFRNGAGVDNTPSPGAGIAFEGGARGRIDGTSVTGSAAAGIANSTGTRILVTDSVVFGNDPDFEGAFKVK